MRRTPCHSFWNQRPQGLENNTVWIWRFHQGPVHHPPWGEGPMLCHPSVLQVALPPVQGCGLRGYLGHHSGPRPGEICWALWQRRVLTLCAEDPLWYPGALPEPSSWDRRYGNQPAKHSLLQYRHVQNGSDQQGRGLAAIRQSIWKNYWYSQEEVVFKTVTLWPPIGVHSQLRNSLSHLWCWRW